MKNIAADKWKHFFTGIVMGIVMQAAAMYLFPEYMLVASIGVFVLVVIICYGFELFSKYTGMGHYEVLDAIAGILGGVAGMLFFFLLENAGNYAS